jgi:hypothetical protein
MVKVASLGFTTSRQVEIDVLRAAVVVRNT